MRNQYSYLILSIFTTFFLYWLGYELCKKNIIIYYIRPAKRSMFARNLHLQRTGHVYEPSFGNIACETGITEQMQPDCAMRVLFYLSRLHGFKGLVVRSLRRICIQGMVSNKSSVGSWQHARCFPLLALVLSMLYNNNSYQLVHFTNFISTPIGKPLGLYIVAKA